MADKPPFPPLASPQDVHPKDIPPGWLQSVHDEIGGLSRHIDRFESLVAERLDRISEQILPLITQMNDQLERQGRRLVAAEKRINDHDDRITALEKRAASKTASKTKGKRT